MFHPSLVDKQSYPDLEKVSIATFGLLTAAIKDGLKMLPAGDKSNVLPCLCQPASKITADRSRSEYGNFHLNPSLLGLGE
jgi:hypothetical protein